MQPTISLKPILPSELAKLAQKIPVKMLRMTEQEIQDEASPDHLHYMIKMSFWQEARRAHDMGQKMSMANIVADVCTPGQFEETISNPARLAWMFRPVRSYDRDMQAMLIMAMDWQFKVLNMKSTYRANLGQIRPDPKVLAVQRRVVQDIIAHAKGMPVRKNVNLNMEADKETAEKITEALSLDAINDRIAKLKGEIRELPGGRDIVDVEVEDDNEEE